MIEILERPLEGLLIFRTKLFEDKRGFFMETYNCSELREVGIMDAFIQDNHSKSVKNVLRGMHFQQTFAQAQIVRVIKGEIYDVAVDIQEGSPNFGRYYGVILSEQNRKQFYMGKGFAHGYLVLSETAELMYKCSQYYHPEDEAGIHYSDETVGIKWPIKAQEDLIISERDNLYPMLYDYVKISRGNSMKSD